MGKHSKHSAFHKPIQHAAAPPADPVRIYTFPLADGYSAIVAGTDSRPVHLFNETWIDRDEARLAGYEWASRHKRLDEAQLLVLLSLRDRLDRLGCWSQNVMKSKP